MYALFHGDQNNSTNPAFVILGVSNGDKDSESKMATVKDHLKELKMPESVDSLITELSAQNRYSRGSPVQNIITKTNKPKLQYTGNADHLLVKVLLTFESIHLTYTLY